MRAVHAATRQVSRLTHGRLIARASSIDLDRLSVDAQLSSLRTAARANPRAVVWAGEDGPSIVG